VRIAILGTGGVGGYFGGRLAASGADVAFIARGAHLHALQTEGLRLISPKGDLHLEHVVATDDPAVVGPADVVFFTVKLYDSDIACEMLPTLVGPQTVVVTFQNGIDSADRLTAAVGREHVAGGVAHVQAAIEEPGVIRHTALDLLIFGELDGARSPRLQALQECCLRAGFDAKLADRIHDELWLKFVRLTSLSGIMAATRSPLGVIRDDEDLWTMLQAAIMEAMAVAHAKGVQFAPNVLSDMLRHISGMPAQAKSSMLEDLEHGRRLELPWLNTTLVRVAEESGVPTPTHRFIATVLKPFVAGKPATKTVTKPPEPFRLHLSKSK
jgi:2-dehydropantoate 2-reductase